MKLCVRLMLCLSLLTVAICLAACGSSDSSSSEAATADASVAADTTEGSEGSATAIDGGGDTFVYNAAGASAQFEEALESSYLKAFDEKFNFSSVVDPFCCGIEKLQAAQNSGNVPWSAVQWVTGAEYELAKEAGLLEPLDTSVVPVDLLEPGTYDKFGYRVYVSGVLVGWLPDTYADGPHPESLKDLFDTEKFPGKRCFYKGIQAGGTLEAALLASGVAPDKLYPLDLERAFDELDKIKDDIVWWETGAESAQYLLDGTCQLGVIWNGVAQSTSNEGNEVEVSWGDAITLYGMNSVPKGSPNAEAAQEFLGLLLSDQQAQAEFASHTAYTEPLIKPTPLPPDVAKWAPQGENVDTAIEQNEKYYAEHNAEITKEFNDWLVSG